MLDLCSSGKHHVSSVSRLEMCDTVIDGAGGVEALVPLWSRWVAAEEEVIRHDGS